MRCIWVSTHLWCVWFNLTRKKIKAKLSQMNTSWITSCVCYLDYVISENVLDEIARRKFARPPKMYLFMHIHHQHNPAQRIKIYRSRFFFKLITPVSDHIRCIWQLCVGYVYEREWEKLSRSWCRFQMAQVLEEVITVTPFALSVCRHTFSSFDFGTHWRCWNVFF